MGRRCGEKQAEGRLYGGGEVQIRPDRNAAVGAQRTELEDRIARVLDKFAHHDQTAERAIQGVISKCA